MNTTEIGKKSMVAMAMLVCGVVNAEVIDVSGLARPPSTDAHFKVAADATVRNVPEGFYVTDIADGPVTMLAGVAEPAFCAVPEGLSVKLGGNDSDWQSKALLWIDPSNDKTIYYYADTTGKISTTKDGGTVSRKLVLGLVDPRAEQTDVKCLNGRAYRYGYYEGVPGAYPYLVEKGQNGLGYLCFGAYQLTNPRRMPFNSADLSSYACLTNAEAQPVSDESYTSLTNMNKSNVVLTDAKFAIMVYGSENGGGKSLFYTSDGYLDRSGTSHEDGIVNRQLDVWLNGSKVTDPTTTGLSGDWDIVSIDLSGAPKGIAALGGKPAGGEASGGQDYGEIILLDSVPSADERQFIERYLAKKWGLMSKYAGDGMPRARLAGKGIVHVQAGNEILISGCFKGILALASDAVVRLAPAKRPSTEAEVEGLQPTLWFDPSAEGAVLHANEPYTNSISAVYQRDPQKRQADADYLLSGTGFNDNSKGRLPGLEIAARALGESRAWVDMNGAYDRYFVETEGLSYGNLLRLRTSVGGSDMTNDSVRMGFIVQDSIRGGGTPFLDGISGSDIKGRAPNGDPSMAIYNNKTIAAVRESPVYLNGREVEQENGFTGSAEVFTFTGSEAFKVGAFGYYVNTQNNVGTTLETMKAYGEIQSEILLFDRMLDDTSRQGVEAYLMNKWMGYVPTGFSDLSETTVAGTGTVIVPNAASRPKFASTYTGELVLEENRLTFDYRERQVGNPVTAGSLTVSGPLEVVVDFQCVPKAGTYRLLTLGALPADFSAMVTASGAFGGKAADRLSLKVDADAGTVDLVVAAKGLILLFR